MGDVIGDLNSRRGQIQGMEARPGAQQIDALVPLSEMFGYATDLRSQAPRAAASTPWSPTATWRSPSLSRTRSWRASSATTENFLKTGGILFYPLYF